MFSFKKLSPLRAQYIATNYPQVSRSALQKAFIYSFKYWAAAGSDSKLPTEFMTDMKELKRKEMERGTGSLWPTWEREPGGIQRG